MIVKSLQTFILPSFEALVDTSSLAKLFRSVAIISPSPSLPQPTLSQTVIISLFEKSVNDLRFFLTQCSRSQTLLTTPRHEADIWYLVTVMKLFQALVTFTLHKNMCYGKIHLL